MMTTGGGVGKRSSNYNVPLNVEQARNTRDALAKVLSFQLYWALMSQALYSRLFDWIVEAVNRAMASLSANSQTKHPLCIGVLDIFGFEVFHCFGCFPSSHSLDL